ncbi:MAG: Cation efflux system protein, AcrB/AcrD/AcrF family protein [Parcubacteria group bacterium GW2011_GWA2_38_13]|nr:MAG: Cation efflux system protein, AcrB/AcrD/AcrF family protein [Parcubacteria group bacterium GW2011_GWA2_38_13]
MFNKIISWALGNKITVLVVAGIITAAGLYSIATMKVDILPDINKPTVTVFAESPGMAAEEVERLILNPIESAIAGAPGVDRIRSSASFAQATINMEFAWGSETLRNRQIVQERLTQAVLPQGVKPVLGPSTSLLGEISWIGITSSNSKISPMDLRTLADWTIRPALLKTPGIANVLVMGGDVREWQININAERMRRYGVMIDDIRKNIENTLTNKSGGLLNEDEKEYVIRILTAPTEAAQLQDISIGRNSMDGRPVRLGDIAFVSEGASIIRGSGAIDGKAGVILRIVRQPDAQTLVVTDEINKTFTSLSASLPDGVELHPNLFRQENFIRAGLENVERALLDGTILVILILIIFLMNIRMTMITLTAIPLSILITAIIFKAFDLSVNVMTLGGIAVAVGELVDDAIVDVENIYRRLRLWMLDGKKENREHIVLMASQEVRNSIVYATILVAVVFLPIFFMPGIEGRLLIALGTAYLVSLFASMAVSLTVTPVLSALLLGDKSLAKHKTETKIVQKIKEHMTPWIYWCIAHVKIIGSITVVALVITAGMYFFAGKEGIPPFNEGSMVAMVFLPPNTALSTTNEYMIKLEKAILQVEGVRQVSNIAGRALADPHGGSANSSEVQIALKPGLEGERDRIFKDIQAVLDRFGGADFSLGQPITHRVEMLLSGVRSPIVVKVFGDDPDNMDRASKQVLVELEKHEGIKNPRIQQNTIVPEFRIYVDRNRLAEYGLSPGVIANDLEMGIMGDTIGQVRLGPASVNVVARYDAESKGTMASLRDLSLPFMGAESSGSIGDILVEGGRNSQDHEGGKRVLVVSANYQGTDVVGAVGKAKSSLEKQKLPTGITLSFEGNYKSQKENSQRLALIFIIGVIMIFGILYYAFKSVPIVLLVMTNIPTVLIGGMIGVWLTGGSVNLAHLVGFISLAGIVSRNGIMLIGRSLTLVQKERLPFSPEIIVKATLDRVVPVLMTSLVAALALIPLILSGGDPGKEMLNPLAVVVFGGLVSSTIISLFLTPALFYRFGKKAALKTTETESGF